MELKRDIRDPESYGTELLKFREWSEAKPQALSLVADQFESMGSPGVKTYESQSLGMITPEVYNAELEERAKLGDRFALALLNGDSLAEDPVD